MRKFLETVACRQQLCIWTLICLVFFGRLSLLAFLPIPDPVIHDEFSHLLLGETLAGGRLSNPTHPFWQHFETLHVLQVPSYSSVYPPGIGASLAIGKIVFGHPWFGVCLSVAIMCGAVCWMLYGWLQPSWALLGGIIISSRFVIDAMWMNSYWGGAVCAIGGALFFGSLPRLVASPSAKYSSLLATGWAIVWFTRPYEAIVLGLASSVGAAAWLASAWPRARRELVLPIVLPATCILAATAAFTGYLNWCVTANAFQMPYQACQKAYGVPSGFYWQSPTPEVLLRYQNLRDSFRWQRESHDQGATLRGYARTAVEKLVRVLGFYFRRSFLLPVFVLLPWLLKKKNFLLLAILCAIAFIGSSLYPFFFPHYLATYIGVFLLFIVSALEKISPWRFRGARAGALIVIGLVLLDVLFSLGSFRLQIAAHNRALYALEQRPKLLEFLHGKTGRHLVFVRYAPRHNFNEEWVYNAARIDDAEVVWARELSPESDQALRRYFHDRNVWVLYADSVPARLVPFETPPPAN